MNKIFLECGKGVIASMGGDIVVCRIATPNEYLTVTGEDAAGINGSFNKILTFARIFGLTDNDVFDSLVEAIEENA